MSLRINEGEIVGLIGANGAGKSTLIKLITGILSPTEGTVSLFGDNPLKHRKRNAKKIGVMMGQRSQLWWDLPVKDSFELYKSMYKVKQEIYEEKMKKLDDMLGIGSFIHKPVRKLSLGQRIRSELGVSLLHSPKLLFLDEPTIGIDVLGKEKILEFIKESNRVFGTTVLLSSHDIFDIEKVASRVLIIDEGKLIFDNDINTLQTYRGNIKIIKIKVNQENHLKIDIPEEMITLIKDNYYSIRLDLDKYDLSDITKELLETNNVVDISIEQDAIENVVKDLYNRKGE